MSNIISRERMDSNRAHRRGKEYDLPKRRSRTSNRDERRSHKTDKKSKDRGRSVDKSKRPRHTEICRFYAMGKCDKGKDCTFRHSKGARAYAMAVGTTQNSSSSAIAGAPVDKSHPMYRSAPCRHYMNGNCGYGDNCKFSHDLKKWNSSKPSSATDKPSSDKRSDNGKDGRKRSTPRGTPKGTPRNSSRGSNNSRASGKHKREKSKSSAAVAEIDDGSSDASDSSSVRGSSDANLFSNSNSDLSNSDVSSAQSDSGSSQS